MTSMVLTPVLIKYFDERKVYVGLSFYGFATAILAFCLGKYTSYHMAGLVIGLFLMCLQFGAVNIMPMIMVADSVDYYEHKTGKRTEGIAMLFYHFQSK